MTMVHLYLCACSVCTGHLLASHGAIRVHWYVCVCVLAAAAAAALAAVRRGLSRPAVCAVRWCRVRPGLLLERDRPNDLPWCVVCLAAAARTVQAHVCVCVCVCAIRL